MPLDGLGLGQLIEESEDLHASARGVGRATRADLVDFQADQRRHGFDPDHTQAFNEARRRLLGRFAGFGLLGGAVVSILARPAAADQSLDLQVLQTASSLERLAVSIYGTFLTLPFVKSSYLVVTKFVETTMMQHDGHLTAFQSGTTALGGTVQNGPDPRYAPSMAQSVLTLRSVQDVVALATTLETLARDTYLSDLAMLSDPQSRQIVASVMGVEAQHLATLRVVAALLTTGDPALVAIPVATNSLPAALGSVGFSDGPFPVPTMASPPGEGAV